MKLPRFYIGLLFTIFLYYSPNINAQGFTVNHLHTNVDLIPDSIITKVKDNYRLIHGHLSHGWQIDDGLDTLEVQSPDFSAEIGNFSLPNNANTLNVMYYYASDKNYWNEGGANTLRGYLNANDNINVALFSWCRDLDENSSDYVYAYLDTLAKLELEYPGVHFIYATGNAQKSGETGLLRFNNNNIIRDYCQNNNKILYDFADLDCWWYNQQTEVWEDSYYQINGTNVPVEHSQFHEELWHHTTVESGIQKAKALWYLLAKLSGWNTDVVSILGRNSTEHQPDDFVSVSSYPNPFNSKVTIEVRLNSPQPTALVIYNSLGEEVYSETNKTNSTNHQYRWDAVSYSSGLYLYKVQAGKKTESAKLLLVK